jgi:hypothetical protein
MLLLVRRMRGNSDIAIKEISLIATSHLIVTLTGTRTITEFRSRRKPIIGFASAQNVAKTALTIQSQPALACKSAACRTGD